jgi:cytoskeleton-associated protein 5
VTVVMKAAQAAGLLAKGLRQAYSPDAKYLVSTLLAKFKEKKANVVTALHEALDAMMDTCFALTDLVEDLPAAADAKTPPGREQTLAFILRFINKSKRASVGQAIKLLGPLLLKAMDDSTPEVREAAYKAFGTLVGKVGERPLSPYLTKLDGIKEKKVKENYPEKIFTGTLNLNPQAAKPAGVAATGKPAPGKKPVAAANGKPAAGAVKKAAPAASSSKPPAAQPAKPAAQGRTTAAAPTSKPEPAAKPAAPAPKPAAPKPKPKPAVPVELPLITQEEAMEKATTVLPETTLPLLEDAQWKNRVAGALCLLRCNGFRGSN